jgi:hypothetical protein
MSSWKSCESRAGIFLGAKGLGKSGRAPLSGSNSGTTRSDTPHPTIFCEVKRDKRYLSVTKLWHKYFDNEFKKLKPKDRPILILTLPEEKDGKVVSKSSDIVCFHCDDAQDIVNNSRKIEVRNWQGTYPAALTLYKETISVWKSSLLDRHKKIAHCIIFHHGKKGFWIIINKNDIQEWWELVLEARIERERLIKEEEEFKPL